MVKEGYNQLELLSRIELLINLENKEILNSIKNGMKTKINQGIVLPVISEFSLLKANNLIFETRKKIGIYYALNQCIIQEYKSYFKNPSAFSKQSLLGFYTDSLDIHLFFYNQKKYFNVLNLEEISKSKIIYSKELGDYLKELKIL